MLTREVLRSDTLYSIPYFLNVSVAEMGLCACLPDTPHQWKVLNHPYHYCKFHVAKSSASDDE